MAERKTAPRGVTGVSSGTDSALNVTAAAVVKARPGFVGTLIVNAAVTGDLTVHDITTTGAVAAANLVFSVTTPAKGAIYKLDFPCRRGIVVTPGSAGTVAVSFE